MYGENFTHSYLSGFCSFENELNYTVYFATHSTFLPYILLPNARMVKSFPYSEKINATDCIYDVATGAQ